MTGAELVTASGSRVALRPATAGDESFLAELDADRRRPELEALGWPAVATRTFLDVQFRARQAHYATEFPDADHRIVSEEGSPVGRLLLERRPDGHLVVDIVLLGRSRGRGIGTAVLRAVLEDAATAGVPVHLTALRSDPCLIGWYEALGFEVVGQDDLHVSMVKEA